MNYNHLFTTSQLTQTFYRQSKFGYYYLYKLTVFNLLDKYYSPFLSFSRIQFLIKVFNKYLYCYRIIFCLTFFIIQLNKGIKAQYELDIIRSWQQYKNAPNALYDHLTMQAYELLNKRNTTINKLSTLKDWQQRQKEIRETLLDIVGPFPEKTALNARILKTIEKEDFRVEHIVFESQPEFYVTSSLFIPNGLKINEKLPAIIFCSGHYKEAYRVKEYQHVIINLVKKGFIVFAFDPVGQGERSQYYDLKTGKSILDNSVIKEHAYISAQTFITGSSLTRYMIWDGIRAVDYLFTRKEVDNERIGIVGQSGGGFQSAYISAFDDRIYASAPGNHISNYTRILQSIGPRDGEQNLLSMFLHGIDHADFISVRAPKPVLIVTTTNDFFSIQGSRETAQEVSNIYNAYNKRNNLNVVEDIGGHEYTKKNRKAIYAFFQENLNNPGDSIDEEVEFLTEEELCVTYTGQVLTSFINSETVYSLNRMEAEKLNVKLKSSREKINSYYSNLIRYAKELSGYREPGDVTTPIFTGCIQREGYLIEKYFIKGEGDYPVPYLLMIPEIPNNKAIIYLHPSGKVSEASVGGEMECLVKQGFKVLAPDIIGTGETGPGWQGGSIFNNDDNNGLSYQLWYASMLIGRSIVGIRAGDVIRLARILINDNDKIEIYGIARKEMCPVLLHAAAFDPIISRVVLIEPYSSYRTIVMNRFYSPNFIGNTVPGALPYYDLPDLAASLTPRKLLIFNPIDGFGESAECELINEDLSIIRSGYQHGRAGNNFFIKNEPFKKESINFFRDE